LAVSDEGLPSFMATYVTSRGLAAGIGTKSHYVTEAARPAVFVWKA
jgi:hypothetical protein